MAKPWMPLLGLVLCFCHLYLLSAEQCGSQAGGAICPNNLCCSRFGWCGSTSDYCGAGCQSGCPAPSGSGAQCGSQAGGAVCAGGLCCSQFGFCGSTSAYCSTGCQSQCGSTPSTPTPTPPSPTPSGSGGVSSLVGEAMFNDMLKHRNDANCPANNFYTYSAFVAAANSFPGFATTGDTATRKREIAAFLGQTSHETTGGWDAAPDGRYAWGYCYKEEQGATADYCVASAQWPCASGKKYYGRGPIQISYNYNYGPAGVAIGSNLLNSPELVASDPTISFKTALWFWMTPQSPKPSCHAVITGGWTPSASDVSAGRLPGYGVLTNIINGGLECGHGADNRVADRIGFYKRYSDILGVSYGDNLDCGTQRPFG